MCSQTIFVCLQTCVLEIVYEASDDLTALERRVTEICEEAEQAVQDGYTLLILSDRMAGEGYVPVR